MGLDDIIKEIWNTGKYILKKPLITFTTLAVLSTFSCNKSNPTGPDGGGGSGGSGGTSGTTNSSGQVSLTINSNNFNVNVRDEDGASLSGISVEGQYNGGGKYEFLFEDFSYNYYSETAYYPQGNVVNGVATPVINAWLSEINPISGSFKIEFEEVPYNTPHPNLTYVGTTTAYDLYSFYEQHDALFRYKSYMEFIANESDVNWFTVALKAEKFRETFIQNISNVSTIINYICNLFGQSYNSEAYYLDVYSNDLGVLTHFENEDGYRTIKGEVENANTGWGIPNACIDVDGPTSGLWYTDGLGNFLLKFILPGSYDFNYSCSGFIPKTIDYYFSAPLAPFYQYAYVGTNLTPQSSAPDTLTKILQPGSEGYDSYTSVWWNGSTPMYGSETHGSEEYLKIGTSGVTDWDLYIQFSLSSIPNNADIVKSELKIEREMFSNNPFKFYVYKINNSWSESSLCYNNKPSSSYWGSFTFPTNTGNTGYFTLDITSLVQNWFEGSWSNYGIKMDLEGDSYEPYTYIISSDNANQSKRPKLTVYYLE